MQRLVLDGGHALGQLTGEQAMALAVERAKRFGGGVVAVRHAFHFGTARRYAQAAAEAGCIGIAMCNTRPLMPAPGGAERVVGNNPIAVALPGRWTHPDGARHGDERSRDGQDPHGGEGRPPDSRHWAVSSDGTPQRMPTQAIAGMLLPTRRAERIRTCLR